MKQPILVDTLQWYRDDYNKARIVDDTVRKELAQLFDLFARNQRLDRDRALRYLEQGLKLASSPEGHPYWDLLLGYWHYTLTSPGIGDIDGIMRLFMKSQASEYRECPIIGRIYASMIEAYVWEDPISYAREIRHAIDYVFEHVPISANTYQRMLLAKARMHYELQEPDYILEAAETLLQNSDDYTPDIINAHLLMAQANIILQSYDEAYDSARMAHDLAQVEMAYDLQRAALVVQADILAQQKQWGSAQTIRYELTKLDAIGAKWLDLAFDSELSYWQQKRDLLGQFASVQFAKQVLGYYVNQDQSYWICRARYNLLKTFLSVPVWIRWLYRWLLQLPSAKEQVQLAQEAATHLKRDSWYLDRLSAIAHSYMD